jgi:hypothetical protein
MRLFGNLDIVSPVVQHYYTNGLGQVSPQHMITNVVEALKAANVVEALKAGLVREKATISCCFQSLSRILPSKCRQVYLLSTAIVHTTAEQDGLNKANLEQLQILITHLHNLFRRQIVIQKKKIQYMVLGLSIGPIGSIQRFFISYY